MLPVDTGGGGDHMGFRSGGLARGPGTNEQKDELTIAVVDKRFWKGKNTLTLADVEKAHNDVILLEDEINRTFRSMNRALNNKTNWVKDIVSNANLNFDTLKVQVEGLIERVERLERSDDRTNSSERSIDVPRDNEERSLLNEFEEAEPVAEGDVIDEKMEDPNQEIWGINMLSTSAVNPGLQPFGDESVIAFDNWAEQFKDHLSVSGKNWTNEDKVTRLKLALKDTPRELFKELTPAQTTDVNTALRALREKLDSPQRREVAKRTLGLCRQRDDKTVAQFLRRLRPLVESTNPTLTADQSKEKVCEEFLDRLKPNVSFLIRLVGLSRTKDLEIVKAQAEELEALLMANKAEEPLRLAQMINTLRGQTTTGPPTQNTSTTSTWNRRQENNWGNTRGFRPYTSPNTGRTYQNSRQNQRGQEQFSQRRWSSNPVCHFCNRTGHIAYDCRRRRVQFRDNGNNSNFGEQRRPGSNWQSRQNANSTPLGTNCQNRNGSVNALQSSSNAIDPTLMEGMIKSLINMNVQNSSNCAGECQNQGLNTIMPIGEMPKQEKNAKKSTEKPIIECDSVQGQGTNKTTRPKTSKWEGNLLSGKFSSTLLIISIISCIFFPYVSTQNAQPAHPLICQNQKEWKVWQLPETGGCTNVTLNPSGSPSPKVLKVYSPNQYKHVVEGWACRKVKKAIKKYTTITNVPVQEVQEAVFQTIPISECKQMIEHGKCSLGVLTNDSGLLHTNRKIDTSPRMWLVGSFNWAVAESENCYLFKTRVNVEHGGLEVHSPLGQAKSCLFEKGECVLDDKTVIMWNPNAPENCEYSPVGIWSGLQMDNVWVSDEASFRLTFYNRSKAKACGKELQLSEEGFAVQEMVAKKKKSSRRKPRSLVTESEVNGKLGYLDFKVRQVMRVAFSQAIRSICEYMVETRRWALSALLTDPTNFARSIFQSGKVVAKGIGPGLIKVWPCVELAQEEYEFLPSGIGYSEKECFNLIPIKLHLNGGQKLAFVDPKTMIVTSTARKAACAEFQKQLIFIDGRLLEVDQRTAQVSQIEVEKIEKLGRRLPEVPIIPPHAFHYLALVNISDILGLVYDANMNKASEMTYTIHAADQKVVRTLSEQWNDVRSEILEATFGGWFHIGQIIVVIMVSIVFADFLLRFGLMLKDEYKGKKGTGRLTFRGRRNFISETTIPKPDNSEVPDSVKPITELNSIKIIGPLAKEAAAEGKRRRDRRIPNPTAPSLSIATTLLLILITLPALQAQTTSMKVRQIPLGFLTELYWILPLIFLFGFAMFVCRPRPIAIHNREILALALLLLIIKCNAEPLNQPNFALTLIENTNNVLTKLLVAIFLVLLTVILLSSFVILSLRPVVQTNGAPELREENWESDDESWTTIDEYYDWIATRGNEKDWLDRLEESEGGESSYDRRLREEVLPLIREKMARQRHYRRWQSEQETLNPEDRQNYEPLPDYDSYSEHDYEGEWRWGEPSSCQNCGGGPKICSLKTYLNYILGQLWVEYRLAEAKALISDINLYRLTWAHPPPNEVMIKNLRLNDQNVPVIDVKSCDSVDHRNQYVTASLEEVNIHLRHKQNREQNTGQSTSHQSDFGRNTDPLGLRDLEPNLHLNSLSPQHTVVIAKLNGMPIRCLMDTGASMTVAPRSLSDELRCVLSPSRMEATSASGHTIKLKEYGHVFMEIAGHKIRTRVNFVDDEDFAFSREYRMIVGCDVFKHLPPIRFDYSNNTFSVGESVIEFQPRTALMANLRVAVAEDTWIAADSQVLIDAKIETLSEPEHPVVIDRPDFRILESGLQILCSVSPPGLKQMKIALVNPTAEPKRLWKNMHIAYANEVLCDENGLLRECGDKILFLSKDEAQIVDSTYIVDFSKSSVADTDLKNLKSLIEEFSDVFSKNQYDLGIFSEAEHHITTTTEEPISALPRRVPYKYREELKKHIDQLLKSGVMVESDTPWVTPIVIVQKKDGGIRPCLDFRKLNDVTIPDRFPLPRLDSIMEKVGGCNFYTSLDLASGYLQIKLSEETSRKCGVITEEGIYQMITMPFGMKNATAAFSRAMAVVLSGLEDIALAYVDDVLIFTKTGPLDEHLNSVRKVLTRFRLYNLKLSPKKCVFASRKMNFLGFVLSAEGYKPSLSRIEIINDLPAPTNVKEVKRFLGKAGFYRRHIENFATLVEPLLCLTRGNYNFQWEKPQEKAFNKIKELLAKEPNLVFPDYTKPFHIFTDASLVGQGGALMQKNEASGGFSAIAYCSRTLSAPERKWAAVQVELSAIIYALREFRPFIFMSEIELHTDHKPLSYLLKKADSSPQLARWMIELQNYQIKVVHISGKQNTLADALSRAAEGKTVHEMQNLNELEDIVEFPVCLALDQKTRVLVDPFVSTLTVRHRDETHEVNLKEEQSNDPEAAAYARFVESGEFPEGLSEKEKEAFAAGTVNLKVIDGILYFKEESQQPRIYVPIALRPLIFDSFHSSSLGGGHLNHRKTLAKSRKYYWPRMYSDIIMWTRLCITCQLKHHPTPSYREEMNMVPANTLFARVGLDLAGPFQITQKGNKHILNMVCWFTKYVISVPVPDTKATTVAHAFFTNCYLRFGGCLELVTDNATTFTAEFFREFCALLYIEKKYATPHWSQGNAATERTFRTFHNILAKYISRDQPDFDEFLDAACFCYNTAIHASTGETPFFLMFGRDPIFCIDQIIDPKVRDPVALSDRTEFKQKLVTSLRRAWTIATEVHEKAQLKFKEQYDKKARPQQLNVGDRVLIKNYEVKRGSSKKFHLPWRGIFRIVELEGVHVTVISCTSPQAKPKKLHVNQVKKCFEMLGPPCTIPKPIEEEETILENLEDNITIQDEVEAAEQQSSVFGPRTNKSYKEPPEEGIKRYNLRQNRKARRLSINTVSQTQICTLICDEDAALNLGRPEILENYFRRQFASD